MEYNFKNTGYYTSIDSTKETAFYINMKSGALKPEPIKSIVGETIEVADCSIINFIAKDENGQPIYIETEDGQKPKMRHRLILITPDRKMYGTASERFFWSFINVCNIIGYPTWQNGFVKIKITEKELEDGKSTLGFEVQ